MVLLILEPATLPTIVCRPVLPGLEGPALDLRVETASPVVLFRVPKVLFRLFVPPL